MLPRVRTILELPVVRAAHPTVLGGADELDREVRWVHVSEQPDMSGLLQGGEMVLSTGLALGDSAVAVEAYLAALEAAGAVALLVELDPRREFAAEALRIAARAVRMPVITLGRRVRFVAITETVHRLIVAEQLDKVEMARSVHETFTALSLESASAEDIVRRAARLVAAPVVLEDLAHRVVAYAAEGTSAPELLADWEGRSRSTQLRDRTERTGQEGWLQTPVGTRTQRWGRLIVPGPTSDDDDAAMVLERAGQALSINRLAERDRWELAHQAQAGLLHELRHPHGLEPRDALARAEALGLKASPYYVPLVIRVDGQPGATRDPLTDQQQDRTVLDAVASALHAIRGSALAAGLQSGCVGLLLAVAARELEESVLDRFCLALTAPPAMAALPVVVGVGPCRTTIIDAAAGLDEADHVSETARTLTGRARPFYRSTDVRLRGLLALLRTDPRAQLFVESELAGILAPGNKDGGADLELLRRYLASGGNKAALARSGYMSRPTLYTRLARLADRLGVDLDDAESRTSLHVAVLLHELSALR